jgi:hypothetical protein
MDEQIGVLSERRTKGQFQVGSVHRVTCLERDYPNPATTCELGTQLRGGVAVGEEVQMLGRPQDL